MTTVSGAPGQPSTGELPNFDLLRAIAVLLVLLDHVMGALEDKYGWPVHPYDFYWGRLGVLLFFVHTSFVLMQSMQRLGLKGSALFRAFYIRRVFRIYPLAIACVAVVLLFRIPTLPWREYTAPSTLSIIANFSLMTNVAGVTPVLTPLWSLPVEVQMYAVLPAFFLFLGASRSIGRLAVLAAGATVIAIILPTLHERLITAVFVPCFVGGVATFVMLPRVTPKVSGAWMLPFLIAVVLAYTLIEDATPGINNDALQWLTCFAVGLAMPHFQQSRLPRLNTVALLIARYSYGIYLFHCLAIWAALYVFDGPTVIQWALAALLLVVSSVASFHYLEQPAIALGARVARGTQRVPRPPQSVTDRAQS